MVNMERDINHDKRPILGISQMTFLFFSQARLFRASHLLSSRGKILKSSLQLGLSRLLSTRFGGCDIAVTGGRMSDD